MTAHTHPLPAQAADRLAEGVTGSRAKLAALWDRFVAALIANRTAQALAEIERHDPRLAADLRAAMERDPALRRR